MGNLRTATAEAVEELVDRRFNADDEDDLDRFTNIIWSVYETLQRPMPWRDNTDPYWILVSEIMLQQTQVERVKEKFPPFIERYPSLWALSEASLGDVLKDWSGLGYNRRARFLHQAAKMICGNHNGVVPSDPVDLQRLPGIGPNTAGSIAAFAHNRPVVFIETNIRRVFLSAFFSSATEAVHDRHLLPLIEKTLCRENPREWYWALMDSGSLLPKATVNPNRRSAHYTRQAKFEQSRRQLRGRIIKLISDQESVAAEKLPEYTGFPVDEVRQAVSALEREGLIRRAPESDGILVPGI